MRSKKSLFCGNVLASLVLSWTIAGVLFFASDAGSAASDKMNVFVVNYPLKYFAERIGGEHVKAVFPAPANIDPAYWMPDIKTIAAYQQADLILLNGAGYAKWIDKVSLPRSKMINTSKKFRDQYIRSEVAVTHSHGPQGEHAHEDVAFITWLDYRLAALQAEAVAEALIRKKPDNRKFFEKNLGTLKSDLLALDSALREIVGKNPSQPLLASHPVYDYLSRGYGLNLKSVHWKPDETTNAEQWVELRKILNEHPSKWMIWEGQPLTSTRGGLKNLGLSCLVFEPYGNKPEHGDFISIMKKNIENIKLAFE